MHCTKKITKDLTWVGANDRRLALFEGIYDIPNGVSYNSYLLLDTQATVLFDTVDKAVSKTFFENLVFALQGRKLDYLVIQHMEPDHSATIQEVLRRYPEVKLVCNQKAATMVTQFFEMDVQSKFHLVKEGDTLSTGEHVLAFLMAPMVHWPEVMVTYDVTDKILFSADAFGTFGALNGAIFADEVGFYENYMDEARRYYTNIVGKYGTQVQALLKKAAKYEIKMICPLHGFVWRKQLNDYIDKYQKWSTYTPEETGVMIAYASVYGDTENVAEIVACRLRDRGIRTVVYDVSVTPASYIIAAAFRYSHFIFASTTYNAGIFVTMESVLHDLAAHNIQNRTIGLIENGSWAATSGNLMQKILEPLKNITILEERIQIRSCMKEEQEEEITRFVTAMANTIQTEQSPTHTAMIEPDAMFQLSYGLFVLTAKEGEKQNGCIINTVMQVTDQPKQITVVVNKQNYTHDLIMRTGKFNVSVLTQEAPFSVFSHFGFQSGREVDKFADGVAVQQSNNGIYYLTDCTNAYLSGQVISSTDCGTHTLFIAEVTEAKVLSSVPSVTYAYYFAHIKPKPQPSVEKKKGFVCKICGYVYEGDTLPDDFICPLCKHGAQDFEPLQS